MSTGDVIVLYDHIPEVKRKLEVGARVITEQMNKEIEDLVKQTAPSRRAFVRTKHEGIETIVEVGPWYIGFLELGTVYRAATPFMEPIANRVYATLVPKMKILGASL